jgi:ribosomal protein L35
MAQFNIMASKSFTKRIRITKNGKIVRRRMAVGHTRTRRTTKMNRDASKSRSLNMSLKTLKAY